MDKHGSESYFVVGEGLLAESGAGRVTATASAAPPFRFSRMGPKGTGKQLGKPNRMKIGALMAAGGGETSKIPSGFTYLGQFIDHDLTFDKTNVMLGANVFADRAAAGALAQPRPRLALRRGPAGPGVGEVLRGRRHAPEDGQDGRRRRHPAKNGFDLPRGAGSSQKAKRRAIIPDPRNDENLAVAQTHLAMVRFHNRVLDTLPASVPAAQKFATARELVTKHYQWMIRTDYLPRICRPSAVNNVFNQGRKVFEVGAIPTDVPTMPIEFSVAAFRLGHSMIRATYNWNKIFDDGFGSLELLFTFSATGGDLGGSLKLPSNWIADFRRLYDFKEAGHNALGVPASKFNFAKAIDTRIVDPLRDLPPATFGGSGIPSGDPQRNLAFRNLTAGADGAARDRPADGDVHEEQGRQLPEPHEGADPRRQGRRRARHAHGHAARKALRDTPLWFYVLREAEFNNGQLRGVGARIVAETIHRAMEGSTHSIVRDPAFRPSLGPEQQHVPDGRPAVLRVRGEEDAAGAGRLILDRDLRPQPRAAARGALERERAVERREPVLEPA